MKEWKVWCAVESSREWKVEARENVRENTARRSGPSEKYPRVEKIEPRMLKYKDPCPLFIPEPNRTADDAPFSRFPKIVAQSKTGSAGQCPFEMESWRGLCVVPRTLKLAEA